MLTVFGAGKIRGVKPGNEIVSFVVVDILNRTTFSLESFQTPQISKNETGENLVDHYVKVIIDRIPVIVPLNIRYMVVDAFFSKKRFVDDITSQSTLEIVGRLINGTNLRCQFNGK
jgi:hypothetical protein